MARTYLTLHRVCINLAHVQSLVFLLHALYVEIPRGVIAVRHRDPVIVSYHVIVDRLDRLGIHF